MSRNDTLALVLVFLTALSIMVTLPVFEAAITENTWETKAPMHVARSYLGVACVNGKLYAIGGSTQSGNSPNFSGGTVGTNEEYNSKTDTWTFKQPMITPMSDFAIAVYNDQIYCMSSGINQVYNPTTDTWENKTPMPTARSSLQANVVNDRIYLVGGQIPGVYTTYNDSSVTLNEEYNPATDTWTTKAPIPFATRSYASAVFDNKLYIFGGLQLNDQNIEKLTQIYDPKNDSWSIGSSSPMVTSYAQAGVITGVNAPKQIYLIDTALLHLSSNQVYDPENNSWNVGVALPASRKGFGVGVLNDMIYAIGGNNETMPYPYSIDFSVTQYAINEQYMPFGYGTMPQATPTNQPTPTPTVPEFPSWTIPLLLTIMLATAGLLVYFKKHKNL